MYGFSICYIVILINSKMTSRNGSLSLYLTMATVNVIVHVGYSFGQQMLSTSTNLEFYSMVRVYAKLLRHINPYRNM